MKACSASVVPGYLTEGGRSQGHLQLAGAPRLSGEKCVDSQRKTKQNTHTEKTKVQTKREISIQKLSQVTGHAPSQMLAPPSEATSSKPVEDPTKAKTSSVPMHFTRSLDRRKRGLKFYFLKVSHFRTLCSFSLLLFEKKEREKRRLLRHLTP